MGFAAANQISGTVFLDANENGDHDGGETPLAGVHVSDGNDIVVTGVDGEYLFNADTNNPFAVFVTVPDGYRSSGNFYWVPTGGYSNDFGLIADSTSLNTNFSFVHGADIQYIFADDPTQLAYDMDTLDALTSIHDLRFHAFAGDLTSSGKEDNLLILKGETENLARPFHAGFGGHDGLELYQQSAPSSMLNFVNSLGPYAYAWNYGGVHFIALVSETYFLNAEELARQSNWLAQDLALLPTDKPLVVMCHTPEHIASRLSDIDATHNLKAILRGHWHIHNLSMRAGIPEFCSAPWRNLDWGAFTKKCRIVSYEDGAFQSKARVLNMEAHLVIVSPQGQTLPDNRRIVANVYDTVSIPDSVEFEITPAGGPTVTGQLTQESDFTWATNLPSALPPGTGSIVVRAIAGGRTWERTDAFEVRDLASPACAPQADWPSIFGPTPGSRSVATDLRPPLFLRWVAYTGNSPYFFSSPVVHGGRVYLGLADGQAPLSKAGVICLDAETGETLWRTGLTNDIHGTVAAYGDSVYALGNNGMLYRLSRATGDVLWTRDVCEGVDRSPYSWSMTLSPLSVSGGNVYAVAFGGYTACFAADSGTRLWGPIQPVYGTYQRSGLCLGDGRGHLVDETSRVALNLADGSVLWDEDSARERGAATPVFHDGFVYIQKRTKLRKIDAADGSVAWEHATGTGLNYNGVPAVSEDGATVVIAFDRIIVALDAATGNELWTFSTPTPGSLAGARYLLVQNGSSPAISGDFVYVASDNGIIYVLDIVTGQALWQHAIGVPIKASIALSGNMLFVSAFDGNIYAFSGPPALTGTPPPPLPTIATGLQSYWSFDGSRTDYRDKTGSVHLQARSGHEAGVRNTVAHALAGRSLRNLSDSDAWLRSTAPMGTFNIDREFTVSFWLRQTLTGISKRAQVQRGSSDPENSSGDYTMFSIYTSQGYGTAENDVIWLVMYGLENGSSTYQHRRVSTTMTSDKWHHVVLRLPSTAIDCTLDVGNIDDTDLTPVDTWNWWQGGTGYGGIDTNHFSTNYLVGGAVGAGTDACVAMFDEWAIWNRRLSDSEVEYLFDIGKIGMPLRELLPRQGLSIVVK